METLRAGAWHWSAVVACSVALSCAAPPIAPAPPSAPRGVSAAAGPGRVTVTWSPVEGATTYSVYAGAAAGVTAATGTKLAATTSPAVEDGLPDGTARFYIVDGVGSRG